MGLGFNDDGDVIIWTARVALKSLPPKWSCKVNWIRIWTDPMIMTQTCTSGESRYGGRTKSISMRAQHNLSSNLKKKRSNEICYKPQHLKTTKQASSVTWRKRTLAWIQFNKGNLSITTQPNSVKKQTFWALWFACVQGSLWSNGLQLTYYLRGEGWRI